MAALEQRAIPEGSTVLITGAAGWVGSNVCDQFLAHGYLVRGTTRDVSKAAWTSQLFERKYGPGKFELLSIPDMTAEGAYDEAVKGVTAFIHTASPLPGDPDPDNVVPGVVAACTIAIKAAYAEPSVKRFVLTSSSSAALISLPGMPETVVTKDTWNETAIKLAWEKTASPKVQTVLVYAASKALGEKAVWKYYEENRAARPDLAVNTVLPNMVYGKSLGKEQEYTSSGKLIASLYKGDLSPTIQFLPPQYFISPQDTGLLHLAGAIHQGVQGERLLGFAQRYCWDEVLAIFRKHQPAKKFVDDFSSGADPTEVPDAARAEQVLREMGQPGWESLEHAMQALADDLQDQI